MSPNHSAKCRRAGISSAIGIARLGPSGAKHCRHDCSSKIRMRPMTHSVYAGPAGGSHSSDFTSSEPCCAFLGAAMYAVSQFVKVDPAGSALTQRVAAILHDEIANGALANIRDAGQTWSAQTSSALNRDAVAATTMRHPVDSADVLLAEVLDLLAPRPAAEGHHQAARAQQAVPSPAVLSAQDDAPAGGSAEIRTSLQNDGPTPFDAGFIWSDLTAEPDGLIPASYLRLAPERVRIPPGGRVELTISLDVPVKAQPGLYRVLLQSKENTGLLAVLSFPVVWAR